RRRRPGAVPQDRDDTEAAPVGGEDRRRPDRAHPQAPDEARERRRSAALLELFGEETRAPVDRDGPRDPLLDGAGERHRRREVVFATRAGADDELVAGELEDETAERTELSLDDRAQHAEYVGKRRVRRDRLEDARLSRQE